MCVYIYIDRERENLFISLIHRLSSNHCDIVTNRIGLQNSVILWLQSIKQEIKV